MIYQNSYCFASAQILVLCSISISISIIISVSSISIKPGNEKDARMVILSLVANNDMLVIGMGFGAPVPNI